MGASLLTTMQTTAAVDVGAAIITKTRSLSLDRARTFLTLVVLLHHAIIPYTYFGHTDAKSFFGFDMIVLATDSFFMAMFFFLSGLFAWSGIARKGPLNYLSDRLLRALDAILAVRLRPAGDRQGDDWICADGRVQLGADPRIAANPRSGQGALVVYVNWFLSVKTKVLESGGYRVELMRGPRSGMACLGFRRIEIAQLCSVCVSLLN